MTNKRRIPPEFEPDSDTLSAGGSSDRPHRMRVARACNRCKTGKVKCDGNKPCQRCQSHGSGCVYSESANGSGSEPRPKLPSAIPIRGSGEVKISQRLEAIEAAIHRSTGPRSIEDEDEDAEYRIFLRYASIVQELHAIGARGKYATETHKIRFSKRYLFLLPCLFGRNLYNMMSPQNRAKVAVPRIQGYGWNMGGGHYLPLKSIEIPPADLISEDLSRTLLEYYFTHINPLFCILHKPMFYKMYDGYLASKDKRECLLFMGLYYLVCAISMRFSEIELGHQYPEGLEELLFDHGYSIINTFTFQWETVEIIQGWVLVTMYLRTCHRQSSAWIALGNAMRLIQGMGIMKYAWSLKVPGYARLKMIRVFWAAYMWDRLLSMDLGRPFSIRDDEIGLERPMSYAPDGWLEEPAYLLLRLTYCFRPLVHDFGSPHFTLTSYKALNEALVTWNEEIAAPAGIGGDGDLLHNRPDIDPVMVSQIRLQYYEALLHSGSASIMSLLGLPMNSSSLITDLEISSSACMGIIDVSNELEKLGKLCTCWWLRLSSIHTATMYLIILIDMGYHYSELMPYLSRGFELIDIIASDGRFGMSNECQWSLKMLNHMVSLRLKQTDARMSQFGYEVARDGVNDRHFGPAGILMKDGSIAPPHNTSTTGSTPVSQLSGSPSVERHYSNSSQPTPNQHTPSQQTPSQQTPSQQTPSEPLIPQDPLESLMSIKSRADDQTDFLTSIDWFNSWNWDVGEGV